MSGGNVQPSFHSGFQADRSGWKSVLVSELTGRRRCELSDAEHIDVPCKADEGLNAAVAFGDAAKRENSLVARNILFWLEEGREPTEHILNEMMDLKGKNMKKKSKSRLYLSFAVKIL